MTEIVAESYLKADALEDGAKGVILDEGVVRAPDVTGFEDPIFEIGVEINGIRFRWTMNATSQRNLASRWGRDAGKWVGKKVSFKKNRTQAFGRMVDVIYGYPED